MVVIRSIEDNKFKSNCLSLTEDGFIFGLGLPLPVAAADFFSLFSRSRDADDEDDAEDDFDFSDFGEFVADFNVDILGFPDPDECFGEDDDDDECFGLPW